MYYNSTLQYHNHGDTECESCKYPATEDVEGKTWYIITTADELKWFANWVNSGHTDANAKLGDNITLNQNVLNDKGELNGGKHEQWTPIGGTTSDTCFNGNFDGQDYTISGLYANRPYASGSKNNAALFACIGASGNIINVNIADSYVSGYDNVGLLCGTNGTDSFKGGTIVNCTVSGTVKGRNVVGGVCGDNYLGTVLNCTSNAAVTGTVDYAGGICGRNDDGTVTGCRNNGTVSGKEVVGGICGRNGTYNKTNAKISGCTNTGTVFGTDQNAGGVCGYNERGCSIENSHSTNAAVTGLQWVGGICGQSKPGGTVQSCTSACTVEGTGGICGENDGSVQDCHNTGKVTGTKNSVGGVCGYNSGNIQGCYNTDEVSGKVDDTVTSDNDYIGGVCGKNYGGTLEYSYNIGNVSGNQYVGGVCGQNDGQGTVKVCYNTGNVTGNSIFGGVCGANNRTVENCYYLVGTSENAFGDGSEGVSCESKTAAEFQSGKVAFLL